MMSELIITVNCELTSSVPIEKYIHGWIHVQFFTLSFENMGPPRWILGQFPVCFLCCAVDWKRAGCAHIMIDSDTVRSRALWIGKRQSESSITDKAKAFQLHSDSLERRTSTSSPPSFLVITCLRKVATAACAIERCFNQAKRLTITAPRRRRNDFMLCGALRLSLVSYCSDRFESWLVGGLVWRSCS